MKLEDSTAEAVTASAQDALRITVNAMKYAIMNNLLRKCFLLFTYHARADENFIFHFCCMHVWYLYIPISVDLLWAQNLYIWSNFIMFFIE